MERDVQKGIEKGAARLPEQLLTWRFGTLPAGSRATSRATTQPTRKRGQRARSAHRPWPPCLPNDPEHAPHYAAGARFIGRFELTVRWKSSRPRRPRATIRRLSARRTQRYLARPLAATKRDVASRCRRIEFARTISSTSRRRETTARQRRRHGHFPRKTPGVNPGCG